jgi:hypothetical protein
MKAPQFRCSDDARARGDRAIGTAPPARNWFLVEQEGAWGPTSWHGLQVGAEAKEELEELLEDADARLMLIRRPGRPDEGLATGARRWCVIQSDPRREEPARVVWGRATDETGLLAAATLFADPAADIERIDPPAAGSAAPAILLICAHGRKDVCCAVRGRPVAARAAELWPDSTWECTHTGGDRFAANLIVLPDGACYGSLDPEDVQPIVAAHLRGEVDPAHLRGPTGYSNRSQAAIVEAYTRFGPLPFGAVRLVSEEGRTKTWRVQLEVRGLGPVEMTGHIETTQPELLTCKADQKKVMHLPVVDTVVVERAPV